MRSLLWALDMDAGGGLGWRNAKQCSAHQFGEVGLEIVTHRGVSGGELGQAPDYTMHKARSCD